MGSFRIEKNARVLLEGVRMRIRKKVREDSRDKWQLEEEGSGAIVQKDEEELFKLHYTGDLRFVGEIGKAKGKTAHRELLEAEKEEIQWRMPFVRAVLKLPVTQPCFEAAILEVWNQSRSQEVSAHGCDTSRSTTRRRPKRKGPPGWVSVYRWRERYIRSGKDAYSLLSKGCSRLQELDLELGRIVDQALEEEYLTHERKPLQEVINTAKHMTKETNKKRQRLGLPLLTEPSRRQVQRSLALIPAFDVYVARYGRDAAMNKFRSVTGHRTTSAPLERAEIDHTPLDLFVVDDINGLPLGRPFVTACIDDYTRCILGMYVGFVPPSYESVAHCLMHAFVPKVTQNDEYPDVEYPWLAYGVMQTLVCDNGTEFHSEALENACEQLGINMEYAPRKTGWYKGKIERFLRRLNEEIAHGTPGTTFSNVFERGDYNPEKHAVIRLSTLKLGLSTWVCDVYHQKQHSALNMPPETMWKLHARTEDIRIPGDPNSLKVIMGRPYQRLLTHKGIEFAGLYYGSEAVQELRLRYGSTMNVEIRVNLDNIGEIHVLYREDVATARALKWEYANGLSLWLHEQIKKHSPKYDPDVWLAGREKLHRLFSGEKQVIRKLSRKGKGRTIEILGSSELPPQHPTHLLPPASTVSGSVDEPFVFSISDLPGIPSFNVIDTNGDQ